MKVCAYGSWDSALSPQSVVAGQATLAFPMPVAGGVFYLESLPAEENHFVLFFIDKQGARSRVSPAGFNLRSRVHEYGGLPFAADDHVVFWVNFSDQRIYRQLRRDSGQGWTDPEPLTAADSGLRFADFCYDKQRQRLLCVCEEHGAESEVLNRLVALNTAGCAVLTPQLLFGESDFVAAPALSPCGNLLAFISWQHPAMPWDQTELNLLSLNEAGEPVQHHCLPQSKPGSLLQPQFGGNGDLFLLADWTDFWNLYRLAATALSDLATTEAQPVLSVQSECCSPPWQLGHASYAVADDGGIYLSVSEHCLWQLLYLAEPGAPSRCLLQGQGAIEQLRYGGGQVSLLAACATEGISLLSLTPDAEPRRMYSPPNPCEMPAAEVSCPAHISFNVAADEQAHGLFYAPCNSQFSAPDGSLPPLIVTVHGGPTSTARAVFSPAMQFWTSRGFAILDINHRGSSGYGGTFRRRLYGQWGVVDIEDIIAGVRYLVDTGQADPDAILIRGGSAGGYAVLAALCDSDLFAGGACYYGVSDLESLAADTHKFESRYLDLLIGPYPATRQIYIERSPIRRVQEISVPVLFLQGGKDKVVPPNQTETMARELEKRNPGSCYLLFPGEGHGFRAPASQIAALQAELAFYREILL